jgi:hypothetical protein
MLTARAVIFKGFLAAGRRVRMVLMLIPSIT